MLAADQARQDAVLPASHSDARSQTQCNAPTCTLRTDEMVHPSHSMRMCFNLYMRAHRLFAADISTITIYSTTSKTLVTCASIPHVATEHQPFPPSFPNRTRGHSTHSSIHVLNTLCRRPGAKGQNILLLGMHPANHMLQPTGPWTGGA